MWCDLPALFPLQPAAPSPEVGVMGAAARPFMFRAAICCIWAAAKAAMGFRYPPCATDAMIAACCCISWNKESRKKYHAVTAGAACGTGHPGRGGCSPRFWGLSTSPLWYPQAWSFFLLWGLEQKHLCILGSLWPPP